MTAGRDADAYAPEWPKCQRCGTRRPREALCVLVFAGEQVTDWVCLDIGWCSVQAGVGKAIAPGLEGGPESP